MMGMTWYFIGLVLGLSLYVLFKLRIRYGLEWLPLTLCGSGIGLILFAAAWGVAAMLEGVPRAASMGLLLFGLPGIVLTTYGARLIANAANLSSEGSDA
ncbi:MAG: hypothetical protein OCC46_09095 [Pseudodesulfovibrio sp.]